MPVDVLLFGAHPDDVECALGGTAALLGQRGVSFALIDLTRGEMGSRGTGEERQREAEASAEFLGAAARENLDMGDAMLEDTPEARKRVARVIRKHRPQLVVAPYWEDLHNDHAAAGQMVRHSLIYCTLSKLEDAGPPHKPRAFLYYLLHKYQAPTLVVDITAVFEKKMEAIRHFQSQFAKTAAEYGVVPVGRGDYLFDLETRSRYYGSLVHVKYGEALISERPLRAAGLEQLLG